LILLCLFSIILFLISARLASLKAGKQIPVSDLDIRKAADVLHSGGIVAFPTETYYGLAVDPFNAEALQHLFFAKRRQQEKPILTLVDTEEQLPLLVRDIPPLFQLLMNVFWPGPLTLVFQARTSLPRNLTGHTSTVGVRRSSHPVARLLPKIFGGPVTATSANISGQAPATTADQVARQFNSTVTMILDGGSTPGGAGSTLVGISGGRLQPLREGAIPFTKIKSVLSQIADRQE
jgi:L-threonylcarbamoyladenylate synthase